MGISSGMKRPPSDARPLRTTSSKESWLVLQLSELYVVECGLEDVGHTL